MKRRFMIRLFLFLLPIFTGVATIYGTSIYIGDAAPIPQVVDIQSSDEFVLFSVRSQDVYAYKTLTVLERNPRVIALGSSRALGFRSMFFNNDSDNFYNTGMVTGNPGINIEAMQRWAEMGYKPEVVIWALDHHWFAEDWERWFPRFRFDLDITRLRLEEGTERVIRLLALENFELFARREPVYNRFAMGVEAILNGIGYRNDGSIQWSNLPDQDANLGRDLRLFEEREEHYLTADNISPERLAAFEAGIQWMLDNNMKVVLVLPPFAPTIYDLMIESGEYGYLQELNTALTRLSGQYTVPFYDFTDAESMGATDTDMADGWHASEKLFLQMYLSMLRDYPDIFSEFSDPEYLQQRLDTAENQFDIFGEQF